MSWTSSQKYLAEFVGTFVLLLLGGGSAVFTASAGFEPLARVVVVSLTFGFVLLALAYAFGDISGGHFNPAVTISMAVNRRLPMRDVVPYLVAQIIGGIVGIAVVWGIVMGTPASTRTPRRRRSARSATPEAAPRATTPSARCSCSRSRSRSPSSW